MPTEPIERPAASAPRHRPGWVIAAAAALTALYAGLVVAYAIGGASTVDQSPVDVPAGGIEVVLTVRAIDAGVILLPVTTWIVGWKLLREDRLFEAGFLGWIGAMLFATIPIRNFFPGSPPPGSWVDVLVTLWVIVALAVVLLVALAAFIKNPRPNH